MRSVLMAVLTALILLLAVLTLPRAPQATARPCFVGAHQVDPDACERR